LKFSCHDCRKNRKPQNFLRNRKRVGALVTVPLQSAPEMTRAGNDIAGQRRAAYAFRQMNTMPKSVYLYLSSEKDFVAFRFILTKTQKRIDTIDSIGVTVFSMVSPNVA